MNLADRSRRGARRGALALALGLAVLAGSACVPLGPPWSPAGGPPWSQGQGQGQGPPAHRPGACPQRGTTHRPPARTNDAPVDPAAARRYQAVLDQVRAAGQVPGLIAGVFSPDGSWMSTSGTEGEGLTAPPTPQHLTRIGSLTKTMTATVLLQLVEECQVSLDDPIGRYVPGIPNPQATLRQVADMSSGIPSYTAVDAFIDQLFANPERIWTAEELVGFIRGAAPSFAPGAGWEYSNTNYVLLGMVIEQVTHQPIADVFQQRLFGPLGMDDTSYPDGSPAIGDPHLSGLTAQGQRPGKTTDATGWSPSEGSTAGEVISTFDDLRTWARALFTGDGVLTRRMQKLRLDSVIYGIPPADSPTSGYGIGIGNRDGWWGHDGQIPGYTTAVSYNYDLDTTIIVLANSDIPVGHGPPPAPAVLSGLIQAITGP